MQRILTICSSIGSHKPNCNLRWGWCKIASVSAYVTDTMHLVTMALRIYAMYQGRTIVILSVCVFGLYSIVTLTVSNIIYNLFCEVKWLPYTHSYEVCHHKHDCSTGGDSWKRPGTSWRGCSGCKLYYPGQQPVSTIHIPGRSGLLITTILLGVWTFTLVPYSNGLLTYCNFTDYLLAITSSILFDVVIFILTAYQTWCTWRLGLRRLPPLYALLFRDGE